MDIKQTKGGRGFYVCPTCVNHKKFKSVVKMDREQILKQLENRINQLLQIGWRGRIITIGYDEVEKLLNKNKKGFLILAEDLAERSKRNILRDRDIQFYHFSTKGKLGSLIGRGEVGIVFVPDTKFGLKLKNLLNQYNQIQKEVADFVKD
ncbi:MAG: hypothetical protein GXO45_02910 [Aquificae bacterium]|nr:hypothetical protein [Aquificota bacterium]